MTGFVVRLPFESPPLRSNDRMHWAQKAKLTKMIRYVATLAAIKSAVRDQKLMTGPVTVELIWTVTDHRRRDAGASAPTLKAALDGIVDAGLLPGDHHEVVRSETCSIRFGTDKGVRVEIRDGAS